MRTLIAAMILLLSATASAAQPTTYALVVAHNGSVDVDVKPLRYADDDGARFYELFNASAKSVKLLTTLDAESQALFGDAARVSQPPSRENLKAAVADLSARIAADRKQGEAVEVYVVFTGHGAVDDDGEGYLSLADGPLKRSELLRDVISPLQADYTHVIIDACHAYFMVNARGGEWKDDRTGETLDQEFRSYLSDGRRAPVLPTVGVILSTAGAQEVHEWSAYGGGVFSHQLRSALVGAADADGDGVVTYPEVEAYLVAANAAVTNPRARIHVHVAGPGQDKHHRVVGRAQMGTATVLEVPGGDGPMWIEDRRGLRYADLNVSAEGAARVSLLASGAPYWLRTDTFEVAIPSGPEVALASLARQDVSAASRGAVQESFRRELFQTPFGPSFLAGYQAAQREMDAQIKLAPLPSAWRSQWVADYRLGAAVLDASALQHTFGLSWAARHAVGGHVGAFAEYGGTFDTMTIHRLTAGVEVGWLQAAGPLEVEVAGRVGPQALFVDNGGWQADPVGLHVDAGGRILWPLADLAPFLTGGVAWDVVTRAGVQQNVEDVVARPYGGVGLKF